MGRTKEWAADIREQERRREDDHGNPMCHDCGCVHVRFHGDVCKPCASEYRYNNL